MTLERNNHPKKLDFRHRLGRKVIGRSNSDARIVTGHPDKITYILMVRSHFQSLDPWQNWLLRQPPPFTGFLIQMSQAQPRPPSDATAKAKTVANNRLAQGPTELDENEGETANRFLFFNVMPSWMVSFLTHIAIIIILAITFLPKPVEKKVSFEVGEQSSAVEEAIDLNLNAMEFDSEETFDSEISEAASSDLSESMEVTLPEATFEFGNLMGAEDSNFEMESAGELTSSETSNETGSRTGDSKNQQLKKYGGNAASEESVALALKWIVDHQLPDGGWSFDHQQGPGNHRSSPDPGSIPEARAGATAIALLALLGNGQTHKTGNYKKEVQSGLEFLIKRAKGSGRGISYLEPGGTMYSHGLASIVFGEAYAMTKDPALADFAQGTIWYIEDAQDPVGGGWRYRPREPGDTSAVGWQIMALKSGKISGLNINPRTFKLAEKFLNSVSSSGGAYYGYMDPPRGTPADGRTAVGLLCRMYLGWQKDSAGLIEGVNSLADRGPDTDRNCDMYYNYYATQVVKHFGGETWNQWNLTMRDFLVKSQVKDGLAAGSWTPGNGHPEEKGGRLYATALACMTLEVYYRYLPLYGDSAANDDFPLD